MLDHRTWKHDYPLNIFKELFGRPVLRHIVVVIPPASSVILLYPDCWRMPCLAALSRATPPTGVHSIADITLPVAQLEHIKVLVQCPISEGTASHQGL